MSGLFDIDRETGEVMPVVWEVSDVTSRIKRLLTGDKDLARLTVRGEITNLSRSSAGHIYFSLKDDKSLLKCVAFRREASQLTDKPVDGESALATGSIGLYDAGGSYQLYVTELILAGKGELYLAFERLKKKLQAEGLFDEVRKKPLPVFPRRVGIVTSPTGAAVRDILRVSGELSPHVQLVISPALVQGDTAPRSIIKAMDRLEKLDGIEMIILARGGGSFEDLNCFNDEALARRIASCKLPTVSAVGHEVDFTIADFVADFRAPTPTGAAQMVLPNRDDLRTEVDSHIGDIARIIGNGIAVSKRELATYAARLNIFKPSERIAGARQRVDDVTSRLLREMASRIGRIKAELKGTMSRVRALDPAAVLSRGYAIALGPDGAVLSDAASVKAGDDISLKLKKGEIRAEVKESRKEK